MKRKRVDRGTETGSELGPKQRTFLDELRKTTPNTNYTDNDALEFIRRVRTGELAR